MQVGRQIGDTILAGFVDYIAGFRKISRRAQRHFTQREWTEHDADSRQRLALHRSCVVQAVDRVRPLLDGVADRRGTWRTARNHYKRRIADRSDLTLAETFFNSVTRRTFTTIGVDNDVELRWFGATTVPRGEGRAELFATASRVRDTSAMVRQILESYEFEAPWADLEDDARRVAARMDTFLNNSGGSGTVFTIVGSNFEQPDLTVRVCGNDAEHEVLANGQSLQVTAPRCAVVGPAQVEVCTVRGCARDSNGFNYTVADIAPIITSVISNSGRSGTIFFVDARNLNDPAAVSVKVCGVDADFRILPGGAVLRTLQITAPDCGSGGWAEVEVCNAFGCDSLTEGFDYDIVGGRFLPGDCNSDGSLDLSDGVCLLSHLFVGRPAELPCEGASAARMNDYNGDSNVDLSDGVAVLIYLFQGGSPHAEGVECKIVAGCPNACN